MVSASITIDIALGRARKADGKLRRRDSTTPTPLSSVVRAARAGAVVAAASVIRFLEKLRQRCLHCCTAAASPNRGRWGKRWRDKSVAMLFLLAGVRSNRHERDDTAVVIVVAAKVKAGGDSNGSGVCCCVREGGRARNGEDSVGWRRHKVSRGADGSRGCCSS